MKGAGPQDRLIECEEDALDKFEEGFGRNDGNISVRLWPAGVAPGTSPAVITQSMHKSRGIAQAVVGVFYGNVLAEGAGAGPIVATSDISFDIARDIATCYYPISTANRTLVRQWIVAIRKPEAGIVMGDAARAQGEPLP